ncbi:MAG TPA: hypothetical protein VFW70_19920 [Methylomirabilota bacterium]|nr:hypothetical protein [Methylomirabilota bacterium]
MRRLALFLTVLALVTGCAGYRQDALHRSAPSAGAPSSSTGPTADPDAHVSALARGVIAMGRDARGDLPLLGFLTGGVLLAGLALGVYTIALVYRRAPTRC